MYLHAMRNRQATTGRGKAIVAALGVLALAVASPYALWRSMVRDIMADAPKPRWLAMGLVLLSPVRSARVEGQGYQLVHMADDPDALSDRLARRGWREDAQLGGIRNFYRGGETLTVHSTVYRVFMECTFTREP
jgi:hypothetical protein